MLYPTVEYGLFFLAVISLLVAPWLHRMIHVMHAQEK